MRTLKAGFQNPSGPTGSNLGHISALGAVIKVLGLDTLYVGTWTPRGKTPSEVSFLTPCSAWFEVREAEHFVNSSCCSQSHDGGPSRVASSVRQVLLLRISPDLVIYFGSPVGQISKLQEHM